jgi:2-oxoglutarate ferredoxin oxidoreductase subunit alpha
MGFLNWKIAGAAGEGIKAAGQTMAKAIFRSGYYVHGYVEYPSLIRGGHNTFQIAFGDQPVQAAYQKLDLIIALNDNALAKEKANLKPGGMILGDSAQLPLTQIARDLSAPLAKNTIALGASCFLLNLKLEVFLELLKDEWQRKGDAVVAFNQKAAQAGYDFAKKNLKPFPALKPAAITKQLVISGNEALGLGAVAGGMKYYSAYPMTPMSTLLHYLAANQEKMKIVVHHAEDEIGVINMAIGAGYAGVRAMVGTSGGGFSLMVEGLGLAGVSETPITVILGMRPGPASGMPTWSGQGDLLFAINASQDEFPRIVLTPGDPAQCFNLGKLAQNLAEKYQLPVIILTDKNLGESFYTVPEFPLTHNNDRYSLADTKGLNNDEPFARYQVTASGVSPRPLPGQLGGINLTNSYEHDELGYATEEGTVRTQQAQKRLQKLAAIMTSADVVKPTLYGSANAKTTLLAWGSTLGPILEVLPQLKDTNLIHFSWVWPFPKDAFLALIKHQPQLVTVENNATSQLAKLIRQETGIAVNQHINQWDGRPFYADALPQLLSKI